MDTVLLCGPEKESEITDVLLSAIRSVKASALLVTAKSLSLLPPDAGKADFLILDDTGLRNLRIDKGIAVFKKGITASFNIEIPKNFVAVADPTDSDAIPALRRNEVRTVTCGLSMKDTLTFSSMDSERAVVSLQREIKTTGNGTVYPREFPVAFTAAHSEYSILAATAVLLLSGIEIPDKGLNL